MKFHIDGSPSIFVYLNSRDKKNLEKNKSLIAVIRSPKVDLTLRLQDFVESSGCEEKGFHIAMSSQALQRGGIVTIDISPEYFSLLTDTQKGWVASRYSANGRCNIYYEG